MSGLQRIAKSFGAIVINGVRYVWDYAADVGVPETEMPVGSERWKASERARFPTPPNRTDDGEDGQ